MASRLLVVCFFAIPLISAQNCPFSFNYDSLLNGCLFVYRTNYTYDQMETDCKGYGGHLVTSHNAFENSRLTSIISDYGFPRVFLGTRRDAISGNFYNLDGTQFLYANWGAGQPLGDDCATVDSNDNFWYTMSCQNDRLPAICFVQQTVTTMPTVPPIGSTCPPGWSYYALTKYCYYVGNDATFYDAMQRCSQMGSSLASVHSYQENSFIVGLTLGVTASCGTSDSYKNDVWLGGLYNNGAWTWLDGSLLDYVRFYGSTPRTGATSLTVDSSCGDFTDWRGRDPTELLQYYICKRYSNL
ncbi:unnamed protein product, partial [Mesorhabditis belari]|uniref:C-type lectin domain-containing protein n=1 Tax=Mesorhabditis belari TaxID=2138241 RepID=A0AAF3EK15_9BILA